MNARAWAIALALGAGACGGQIFEAGELAGADAGDVQGDDGGPELDAGDGPSSSRDARGDSKGAEAGSLDAGDGADAPTPDVGAEAGTDAGDACGSHVDGFGQGFVSCDVGQALAVDACRAYCAAVGASCSCGPGCANVPAGSPGGIYAIIGSDYFEWFFAGPLAGAVGRQHLNCPSSAAGAWQ